jgi:hypothetical protein
MYSGYWRLSTEFSSVVTETTAKVPCFAFLRNGRIPREHPLRVQKSSPTGPKARSETTALTVPQKVHQTPVKSTLVGIRPPRK